MKNLTILLIVFYSCIIQSQTIVKPEDVWSDIIEVEQSILQRHVVYDLPGMIAVLIPQADGTEKAVLIGNKVLKLNDKLPDLISKPTVLYSDIVKKSTAANLSYLSFASTSMSKDEEIRFSITETSYTSILDNDINWDSFNERVAIIKTKNPELPIGTKFGVVKVASIITVENQKFKKVKNAGKISGWGFSGGAKHLSESSEKRIDFKVGISLTYSDIYLTDLISSKKNLDLNKLDKSLLDIKNPLNKINIIKSLNFQVKNLIKLPVELKNESVIKQ
jgi:hypothetical protein